MKNIDNPGSMRPTAAAIGCWGGCWYGGCWGGCWPGLEAEEGPVLEVVQRSLGEMAGLAPDDVKRALAAARQAARGK